MTQSGFMKLKEIKNLNSYIDTIYKQKKTQMNNALKEINDAYGHLLEDDDFDDEIECLLQSDVATAMKPPTVSRKKEKEPTNATNQVSNTTAVLRRSSRISNSNYKSVVSSTCYFDAVDENAEEIKNNSKITPFKTDLGNQLGDEVNTVPPHVPKNRIGLLINEVTVSKPNLDVSYIKSSIASHDIINPIGSSTPDANNVSSSGSDDEIVPKSNFHDAKDLKLENGFVQPSPKFLPLKNNFAKLKTSKFEDAQKKKIVRMNEIVEAKKRKREERTQKVAAQLAKVAEAREKRQVVLKYEKQKEDEKSKLQKHKETKSKNTQKKADTKEQLRIKKEDTLLEYKIDHIVDGASSEDEETPKHQVPKWASEEMREHAVNVQAWLDKNDTVYKWFFNERLKTPILEELFSTRVRMRPRTSSAVWHH